MNILRIIILTILSIGLLSSCNDKRNYLGQVKATGFNNISFKLYRDIEFMDSHTGIMYEIVDKNDKSIFGPTLLFGSEDFDSKGVDDYYVGISKDLVYLTYKDTAMAYVIYDTKTHKIFGSSLGDAHPQELADKFMKQEPNKQIEYFAKPSDIQNTTKKYR